MQRILAYSRSGRHHTLIVLGGNLCQVFLSIFLTWDDVFKVLEKVETTVRESWCVSGEAQVDDHPVGPFAYIDFTFFTYKSRVCCSGLCASLKCDNIQGMCGFICISTLCLSLLVVVGQSTTRPSSLCVRSCSVPAYTYLHTCIWLTFFYF